MHTKHNFFYIFIKTFKNVTIKVRIYFLKALKNIGYKGDSMKIRYGGWLIIVIGCLIGIGTMNRRLKDNQEVMNQDLIQDEYYLENERQCYKFVEKYFLTEEGCIEENLLINRMEKIKNSKIRIETQNAYLLYLLNIERQKEFEKNFDYVKDYFVLDDGILLEKIVRGESLGKGSTGDALKLIKICILAYEKWGESKYRDLALTLEAGIYKYGIKDKRLYDHYMESNESEEELNLAGVDLNTIRGLEHYRKEWEEIYDNMKVMMESSYINDTFPFYNDTYKKNTEKSSEQGQIEMKNTLEIVLHLAQVEAHKPQTIEWLREHLRKDGVFAAYDIKTGLAITNKRNVENYAIIARIGKCIGDIELYTLAIEQMLKFQIKEPQMQYRGAFVTNLGTDINSASNLQCLLGF